MPLLLEHQHPLAGVCGVMNAILVRGNTLGEVMLYGSGAGKLPTASAVVSDILACLQNRGRHITARWQAEKQRLQSMEQEAYGQLLRFAGKPDEKVLKNCFGEGRLLQPAGLTEEYAYLTEAMTETALRAALSDWQSQTGGTYIGRVRKYNA